MTMLETPVDNGVNVEALLGARQALGEAPEAAKFMWRTTTEWKNGTHSNSTVEDFFGLGGGQKPPARRNFSIGHPEIFASEDNGATPVEYCPPPQGGCRKAGI